MVRYPVLRVVVGPDFFGAVSTAIFVLRTPVLAFTHDAGRKVSDADGGFGFIYVLATGAGSAEGIDL